MGFFANWFKSKAKPADPPAGPPVEPPAAASQNAESAASAPAQQQADALIAEGNALEDAGDIQAAIGKYEQALAAAPGYWRALLNLGIAFDADANMRQAVPMLRQAHALHPQSHITCYTLGRALAKTGDYAPAIELLQTALRLKPDFFEAHIVLADAYEENQLPNEALRQLNQALALRPGHTGALRNKAILLKDEHPDEAEAIYEEIIDQAPDLLTGYAQLLLARGESERAFEFHKRAFESNSGAESLGALLMSMCYTASVSGADLLPWHRKINAFLDKTGSIGAIGAKDNEPHEKIRLGFISPDFRRHPVAYFAEPLFENIDKEKFDIFMYFSHEKKDDLTERFRALAPHWREIIDLNARDAARQIREDGIDILIDLAGHTAGNRRDVLALKPAPIQATWLGYIGTTGIDEVDFRIVDETSDPPGMTENQHSETLIRLPLTQWCYKPQPNTPAVSPLPALANGCITFGSFNQCAKLSDPCLQMWARLMQQVPGSRIQFMAIAEGKARERIAALLGQHGIDHQRITFHKRVPWAQYFNSYAQVDIALDSWPYTGGTTTCDTLLMGVPVITLAGTRSVARSGASLLTALGHPEWIAQTPDQFVQIGVQLASDLPALERLRASLREQFMASPIADAAGFARRFENAMMQMRDLRAGAQ